MAGFDRFNPYPWMTDINWQPEYRGRRSKFPEDLDSVEYIEKYGPFDFFDVVDAGSRSICDKLYWTNNDTKSHTLTFDNIPLISPIINPGERVKLPTLASGFYYPWHCDIHVGEKGIIIVRKTKS